MKTLCLGTCLPSMLLALFFAGACAQVDRQAVQAQAGAPVAAQVEVVTVPYNAGLPRYVVAIMPFDYGASDIISGGGAASAPQAQGGLAAAFTGGLTGGGAEGTAVASHGQPGSQVGRGMSAQLLTALSRWGNVSVIDAAAITRKPDGTYSCRMNPGEVGPFVIRGTVTEFNETADLSGRSRGASLGMLGAVMGIAGAASGHSGLGWTGAGVAAANPTYQNENVKRSGMVGLDLQLVDGRTARIVRGYTCKGTFTTQSSVSGLSVFGIGGGNAEFAASALGQATRAAMNDAVVQTSQILATVR